MDICSNCGDTAVERVDHNGEEQRVCTSCGVVQESGFFSTDAEKSCLSYVDQRNTLFANQSAPTKIQNLARTILCEGQREGFRKLTFLSSHFRLTSEMKNQAFEMFKKAIANKELFMCRVKKKMLLAGCCVYAVMREHNWPVTVSHMCNALGCTRTDFSEPYYNMLKVLQITISTTPIEDLVDSYINDCKYVGPLEKELLKSRVLAVLQICKDCWLTAGRMPRPILLSAVFISWQSLGPKRDKVTFQGFCKKMGFIYQRQAGIRKSELVKVLCILANNIPWFDPDHVTPKNLFKYLEEILTYSESLLKDINVSCDTFRTFPETSTSVQDEYSCENLEIDDEEIESYIRSEKEVNLIQSLNQTFQPTCKENGGASVSTTKEKNTA